MLVSAVQSANALVPMLVTVSGMVTLVRSVQQMNAKLPMLVMPAGIAMLVSPAVFSKALSPMLVTLPSEGITLVTQPLINFLEVVSIMQLPAL